MTAVAARRCGRQLARQLVKRTSLTLRVAVLVELLRRGDMSVTEDELGVARRHAEVLEVGRRGVSEVVHRDAAEPRLLAQVLEAAAEVVGVDGVARLGAEEQAMTAARVRFERREALTDTRDQRQDAVAAFRLERGKLEVGSHAKELLMQPDLARRLIDVLPREPEHFAAAHAVGEQQFERQTPAVRPGKGDERRRLRRGPRRDRLALPGGDPNERRDVAEDQLLTQRLVQRGAKDAPGALSDAHRVLRCQVIDEALDVGDRELTEGTSTERWLEVQPDVALVTFDRARPGPDGDRCLEPVIEVATDRPGDVRSRLAAAPLGLLVGEQRLGLRQGRPRRAEALSPAADTWEPDGDLEAAVAALADRAARETAAGHSVPPRLDKEAT